MTRERLRELWEESSSHLWSAVRREDPEAYGRINEECEGRTFSERAYRWAYGGGSCERCGAACAFNGFGSGFSRFCGRACANKARSERVNGRACEACGETFTATARNDASGHDVCCSDACYEEWLATATLTDARRSALRATLEGSANPTLDLRREDPSAYWIAVRSCEGETDSERIHRALHGEPDPCRACDSDGVSFVSWSEGFREFCSPACASRAAASNIIRRTFDAVVGGDRTPGVTPLFDEDAFKGASVHVRYPFSCDACGHRFDASLANGNVPLCRRCNPPSRSAETYEGELFHAVDALCDGGAVRNDRSVLGGRELDVWIPEAGVAFEMNGLYWHSETAGGKGRGYHLDKTRECEAHGIHLVHVWGCDWRERRSVVESRAAHLLGGTSASVGARECEVVEVAPADKNAFMRASHLQGECRSQVKMGLALGGRLVAAMTFSESRVAVSQRGAWEVVRFCTRPGLRVAGAAGRLLSHFVRRVRPERVVSFADRAWTSRLRSPLYDTLGFELTGETPPCYWYTRDYKTRLHRFGFRKSELGRRLDDFDPGRSEWENMRANGWDRVWDCGSLRYELAL